MSTSTNKITGALKDATLMLADRETIDKIAWEHTLKTFEEELPKLQRLYEACLDAHETMRGLRNGGNQMIMEEQIERNARVFKEHAS